MTDKELIKLLKANRDELIQDIKRLNKIIGEVEKYCRHRYLVSGNTAFIEIKQVIRENKEGRYYEN